MTCVIFTVFSSSPPSIDPITSAIAMLWTYIGEILFNMFVLVVIIKMSVRIVRGMMGLRQAVLYALGEIETMSDVYTL